MLVFAAVTKKPEAACHSTGYLMNIFHSVVWIPADNYNAAKHTGSRATSDTENIKEECDCFVLDTVLACWIQTTQSASLSPVIRDATLWSPAKLLTEQGLAGKNQMYRKIPGPSLSSNLGEGGNMLSVSGSPPSNSRWRLYTETVLNSESSKPLTSLLAIKANSALCKTKLLAEVYGQRTARMSSRRTFLQKRQSKY